MQAASLTCCFLIRMLDFYQRVLEDEERTEAGTLPCIILRSYQSLHDLTMPGPAAIIARWYRNKPANTNPNCSIRIKIFNETNYAMRAGGNSGIDSGEWKDQYPDTIKSGETLYFRIAN